MLHNPYIGHLLGQRYASVTNRHGITGRYGEFWGHANGLHVVSPHRLFIVWNRTEVHPLASHHRATSGIYR